MLCVKSQAPCLETVSTTRDSGWVYGSTCGIYYRSGLDPPAIAGGTDRFPQ